MTVLEAWAADRLPNVAGRYLDGSQCRFDPVLHDGPADAEAESPEERAAREQVATEVCAACPVWESCLAYVLRTRPARGVWAGLTAAEMAVLADRLGAESTEREEAR